LVQAAAKTGLATGETGAAKTGAALNSEAIAPRVVIRDIAAIFCFLMYARIFCYYTAVFNQPQGFCSPRPPN